MNLIDFPNVVGLIDSNKDGDTSHVGCDAQIIYQPSFQMGVLLYNVQCNVLDKNHKLCLREVEIESVSDF